MNLKQSFQIDDFKYEVHYSQQQITFFLTNPPRRLLPHRADAWLLFWDEGHYEDVAFHVPVWQVLRQVVSIVFAWVQRHGLAYFEFVAATERKQAVYARLLQRYLPPEFDYQQCGDCFYVYRLVDKTSVL